MDTGLQGMPPLSEDDSGRHGQLIDLRQVRERLATKLKDPSIKDLVEALDAERLHTDRLTTRVGDLERDQLTDSKYFNNNVSEVARPIAARAVELLNAKMVRLMLFLGLALLLVVVIGAWSYKTMRSQVVQVQSDLLTKADKAQVDRVKELLHMKADRNQLNAIKLKADQSVVERLSQELRDKDGGHEDRISNLATDLMSKANKDDVLKLDARLRQTRFKVRSLEQRVKELTPSPTVSPPSDTLPKTM